MADWKPSASLENLRRRAQILAAIRHFFSQRGVLEVETPLLSLTTATDPHLDSIQAGPVFAGEAREFFLQTSPEFPMKKLLAAGSGSIFQLGKAFRRNERSRRHNPEFTMLEWYRIGFDEHALMDEIDQLLAATLGRGKPRRVTYRQLFQTHLGLDPHSCSSDDLRAAARRHVQFDDTGYRRDDYLHLLLAQVIEPALTGDCYVHDFPAAMAALAQIQVDQQGTRIARRFELFMDGMEIANGYLELSDPAEQRARFEQDLRLRREMKREPLPLDESLVAALAAGLPACAGVALGVDRLVMIATGARCIDEVVSFTLDRS